MIDVSLCEHLEFTERKQKNPYGGLPAFSYGRRVYFIGKTSAFLDSWKYCPICGHRVRPRKENRADD